MAATFLRANGTPSSAGALLLVGAHGPLATALICVIGFLTDRTDFLDLALLYSLMNFIGMVALLRFSEYGSFREEGADIGSSVKS